MLEVLGEHRKYQWEAFFCKDFQSFTQYNK